MTEPLPIGHAGFPAEVFQQRRGDLAHVMARYGLPVVVVTAPEDIYHLSGWNNQGHFAFTALVVAGDGTAVLVARAMEGPTAAAQAPECAFAGFGDDTDPAVVLADTIRHAVGVPDAIGYQPRSLTFPIAIWQQTRRYLDSAGWVDFTDPLPELRAVHSEDEIACLRAAARISDRGMQAALEVVADGVPEAEVAATIQETIISEGSEYPGFVPLVRDAARADQEHVAWSRRRLRAGHKVVIEMSAAVERYHAPLTRTVPVDNTGGRDAAAEIAVAGQDAIRSAIGPDRTAEDVYRSWRACVDAALGVPNPRHRCGYLIGIGFPPSWVGGSAVLGLRPGNHTVLRPGMAFYIQSWVIKQRVGDHVVSDTVLVTDTGCEPLTTTPRN
jgi:Xaa-Pro dipeptidase